MKVTLEAAILLLHVPFSTRACPYLGRELGGENPHQGRSNKNHMLGDFLDNKTPHTHRDEDGTSPLSSEHRRKLQAFDGSPEEAIANLKGNVRYLMRRNRDLGPKFVRMGFHDCVGGCDGCIDLTDPDNDGLEMPMASLQEYCTRYSEQLSKADCWATAALAAAEAMQPRDSALEYNFTYGRVDCGQADEIGNGGDVRTMPSSIFTTGEVLGYFASNFGFTQEETVAIMGAHSLGRTRDENSGFNGPWDRSQTRLDNDFFELLIEDSGDYQQDDSNVNGLFFWERNKNNRHNLRQLQRGRGRGGGGGGRDGRRNGRGGNGGGRLIMLNADMALVADFSTHFVNEDTGEVDCVVDLGAGNACTQAETFSIVQGFAGNEPEFLSRFHDAFQKMMETTTDDLVIVNLALVAPNEDAEDYDADFDEMGDQNGDPPSSVESSASSSSSGVVGGLPNTAFAILLLSAILFSIIAVYVVCRCCKSSDENNNATGDIPSSTRQPSIEKISSLGSSGFTTDTTADN